MTAAASTHSTSQLAPGYKLDRYELLCPIAEGGMASVWVARQRGKHGFEKLVAIKTILPKFAADIRFREMFLDEAHIASRIEHLNVAQIFDLGEEHDVLYLAMEYVDGDALSKLNRACQRKGIKIPTGIILRVLADTCAGLHEAHELKDSAGKPLEIVHRDVSPHNILVSAKGIAKLIDFGIAKARSRVGGDTSSGVLKGKINYMAPEQALGAPVDRRADVWAVGAILYHLLAGKPPYEGDNQLATLHMLGSGRPPPPLPSAVHPSIAEVAFKALAHSAEDRYATAADLREALEEAMIEAMIPATPADVSSFSAQHLAERTEKRRQAIDIALAAAAERRRVEDLLKPSSERTSSGVKATSQPRPPASSHDALPTAAEVPSAKGTDFSPSLIPDVSEPRPNASSYATLGSAAFDASEITPTKSRKPLVAVLSMIVVAAAVATGVSFQMFRTSPGSKAATTSGASNTAATAASLGTGPATASTTKTAPTAAATPASPMSSDSAAAIPTIAATSLPIADAPAAPLLHSTRHAPAPAPAAAPAPSAKPAASAKPGNVDDGF